MDINGSAIPVIQLLWLPTCNCSPKYKSANSSTFRPAASRYWSRRGSSRLHSASDERISGRVQPSSAGRRCYSARKKTGHPAAQLAAQRNGAPLRNRSPPCAPSGAPHLGLSPGSRLSRHHRGSDARGAARRASFAHPQKQKGRLGALNLRELPWLRTTRAALALLLNLRAPNHLRHYKQRY